MEGNGRLRPHRSDRDRGRGHDAYWQSYGCDKPGNRTSLTDHATTADGTDVTTDYAQPAPGSKRPHAVQQTKVSGGPDTGRTTTFEYDNNGNTTKRTTGSNVQDLKWDAEGHLAILTEAGKTTGAYLDPWHDRLKTAYVDTMADLGVTKDLTDEQFIAAMERHKRVDPGLAAIALDGALADAEFGGDSLGRLELLNQEVDLVLAWAGRR
ncbi:hypothetical protein [Streptomyces sp. NPDC056255]|uniref:hypothetical protein n=1 Tax=Streptomyces sp. NPDC056255 TaxID=3345764 RepID=UPI0035D9DB05